MAFLDIELSDSYWETIEINPKDIEFLYAYLLETEIPLPSSDLAEALIRHRIKLEKQALQEKQQENGDIYLPEKEYSIGDRVQFPAMNWINGEVTGVRPGNNPEVPSLKVLTVTLENGKTKQFAANVADHPLNQAATTTEDTSQNDEAYVLDTFGAEVTQKLNDKLEENKDLVQVGANWFPKSLLISFNVGHLNLAEAVLDMNSGGPLPVKSLLEQIEVNSDDPAALVEFSLNYALQIDPRFDEVGTSGVVQWFLNRLEPEYVREKPLQLQYHPEEYDRSVLTQDMLIAEQQIDDELVIPNPDYTKRVAGKDITIVLTYPHWRIGSLPLTQLTRPFFPTAIETQRVKFTLLDDEGEEISAWVVRPYNYVYGLRKWFEDKELIPGSILRIKRGKKPGEVHIQPEKKRTNREWIRTLLIGADGGIVFAMLKQTITADFNERMAIAIPSTEVLDELWQKKSGKFRSIDQVLISTLKELAKLNPQGQVHAIELYASVNCIRRCPPGLVFSLLASKPEFTAIGDLYYRLSENA